MRLYADHNVTSSIIFEEIHSEIDAKFETLNEQGFIDAFIALKQAPPF